MILLIIDWNKGNLIRKSKSLKRTQVLNILEDSHILNKNTWLFIKLIINNFVMELKVINSNVVENVLVRILNSIKFYIPRN